MEKKKVYVYHMALSNGKFMVHESDGIFAAQDSTNPDEKFLVNSVTLLNVFEETQDGKFVDIKGQTVDLVAKEQDANSESVNA